MLFPQNTFQATLTVCITLVGAFVVTGFASSAYHRERNALGVMHYNQGRSLESQDQLEPALEEYRKALLFTPDKPEYRLSLATALLEDGRLDEAQTHLEQLLAENPTSGPINVLLGRLAVRQKNLPQAIEFYQRGVYEYWPESKSLQRRQARWELANLLNETGDRTGFIAELMQLYNNLPSGAISQKLKLGSLLLNSGATSEAGRVYSDLLKQVPQDAEVRRGTGEVDFNSGHYVSARHEFQRALRVNPKDAESQKWLAMTNEVIDMDPALPSITAAEQIRRSENLLARVVKALKGCVEPSPALDSRIEDAQQMLDKAAATQDAAFSMQQRAAQLWADRKTLCANGLPPDRAVEAVLAGMIRE